jgi:hypothetical protein
MIQKEYEEKNKLISVNNDDLLNIREYIYLLLFVKVENFKKLIIVSLLFATLRLTNHNLYKYSINYLHSLNKKIYKHYKISKINETIYNNNIQYSKDKSSYALFNILK